MSSRAVAVVDQFVAWETCLLLCSLAEAGLQSGPQMVEVLVWRCVVTAHTFNAKQVMGVVRALQTMGIKPGPELVTAFSQMVNPTP